MNRLIAFALGLFMVLFCGQFAVAAVPIVTGYQVQYTNPIHSTFQAACAFHLASFPPVDNHTFTNPECTSTYSLVRRTHNSLGYTTDYTTSLIPIASCPANSTLTGGACVCNAGSTEVNGTCSTNVCAGKIGQSTTVNFTEGFTRTSEEGDRGAIGGVNLPPSDGMMCSAGCRVAAQTSGPGVQPYVSALPTAGGLYRRSLDMPAQHMGQACTGATGGSSTADPSTNPDQASPTCPGFVGEINGKTVCAGTAGSPINTVQMPRPGGAAAVPGNPAAGDKPTTGEGSGNTGAGRTPATGSGGSSGGPAGAAVGPKSTTLSPPTGEEQTACGAPGQPKCGIDESGTPSGVGTTFDTAKASVDASASAIFTGIGGASNISTPSWSLTFQLPTGCTPYSTGIRGFVMNPCTYQPLIHDLMSMIWAAVTAFALVGMVGRTIRGA